MDTIFVKIILAFQKSPKHHGFYHHILNIFIMLRFIFRKFCLLCQLDFRNHGEETIFISSFLLFFVFSCFNYYLSYKSFINFHNNTFLDKDIALPIYSVNINWYKILFELYYIVYSYLFYEHYSWKPNFLFNVRMYTIYSMCTIYYIGSSNEIKQIIDKETKDSFMLFIYVFLFLPIILFLSF